VVQHRPAEVQDCGDDLGKPSPEVGEDLAEVVAADAEDGEDRRRREGVTPVTAAHTSRRALLKGAAAMLTAVPVVVSAGGVPLFDVVADLLPGADALPSVPDLTTVDGRLRAAAEWLGLPPAPLAYDQEDSRGGLLITPELMAWLDETDLRTHLR
jgi:hypothetical protein